MEIIAEGVETIEEYEAVRACGRSIRLFQGFLLARPSVRELPRFVVPTVRRRLAEGEVEAMQAALGTARLMAAPKVAPRGLVIL